MGIGSAGAVCLGGSAAVTRLWLRRVLVPFALGATGLTWLAFMVVVGQAAQTLGVPSALVLAIQVSLALMGVSLYIMATRLALGWALGLPRDRSLGEWLRYFFGLEADKGDILEPRDAPVLERANEARLTFEQALQATQKALRLSRLLPSALLLQQFQEMPSDRLANLMEAVQASVEEGLKSATWGEEKLLDVVKGLETRIQKEWPSDEVREATARLAESDLLLLESKLGDPALRERVRLCWMEQREVSESVLQVYARLAVILLEMQEASEGLDEALRESLARDQSTSKAEEAK